MGPIKKKGAKSFWGKTKNTTRSRIREHRHCDSAISATAQKSIQTENKSTVKQLAK